MSRDKSTLDVGLPSTKHTPRRDSHQLGTVIPDSSESLRQAMPEVQDRAGRLHSIASLNTPGPLVHALPVTGEDSLERAGHAPVQLAEVRTTEEVARVYHLLDRPTRPTDLV
jgi:hypothetical protein